MKSRGINKGHRATPTTAQPTSASHRDVVVSSPAVSRRRSAGLDRIARRRAKHFHLLFNSHLFDFHEGWMYVLGVGIAGGTTFKRKSSDDDA